MSGCNDFPILSVKTLLNMRYHNISYMRYGCKTYLLLIYTVLTNLSLKMK